MKKRPLLWHVAVLVLILLVSPVRSAAQVPSAVSSTDEDPELYFNLGEMTDLLKWLPAPPDTIGEAFAHDLMRYFWAKTQRLDPERAEIAVSDADFSMLGVSEAFSVPFGLTISETETPEIYKLLERGLNTIDLICLLPKDHYMRKRPFDRMNEPSLTPDDEPFLALDGSYPSAHTIRGWGAALLLLEINPAAADTLLARGLMYGDSRLIVGAHWQSDVDAGRLAASAAYAKLHTSAAFMRQMAKAQEEFLRLKGGSGEDGVRPLPASSGMGNGRAYTPSGTPATPTTRGIVVHDGRKEVRR